MDSNQKNRKAKAGLLLIASPRFKNLGEGLPHGTYGERKAIQVEEILGTLDFLDVVFPGIVYEREDVGRAMERFYAEKVDFVIAEFLSWSEDFAWIRFLRDMPELPMIFVNVARERMAFRDTLDETTSSSISVPEHWSDRSKARGRCPASDGNMSASSWDHAPR